MGVGGCIRGSDRKWCVGFTAFVGLGDCLTAKFQAVLCGLQFSWDKGLRNIILESDVLDVIHALKFGLDDSSSPHLEIFAQISELLR
ncbi:Reverse transcriptase-like [Sesbania bispinosa]|nr:Reverse transcriptase-like [Sesbania bispinosa]